MPARRHVDGIPDTRRWMKASCKLTLLHWRQAANDILNELINEIQLFVDHVTHLLITLTVKLLDASV